MTEPMGERGRQGAAPLGGHTPGPWQWVSLDGSEGPPVLTGADPRTQTVAIISDDWESFPPSGADARLIAAAPELLEALRLEHQIEDGVHHEPPCSVCDLDYRIRGEQ